MYEGRFYKNDTPETLFIHSKISFHLASLLERNQIYSLLIDTDGRLITRGPVVNTQYYQRPVLCNYMNNQRLDYFKLNRGNTKHMQIMKVTFYLQ